MNIVIICSSMRVGNSFKLCDSFEQGAKEAGNTIRRINLRDINLKFCVSCCDCYNIGQCTLSDDMNSLYSCIQQADILVFATPIYFGEISGQLKVFLDRLYPIYQNLNAKKAYVIATCYANDKSVIDKSIYAIHRFLEDAGNIPIAGVIYGENTDEANDITQAQLVAAYKVGKEIK